MYQRTRKYGYLDRQGEVVIPAAFKGAWDFSEFLAQVKGQNNLVGYITKAGQYAMMPQFDAAMPFREGFTVIRKDNIRCVIDKRGKILVSEQDCNIDYRGFNEGLLVAGKGLYGYLDHSGDWAIEPTFEGAMPFCGGLAPVMKSKLWGYIDKRGNIAIEPKFKEPGGFVNGIASVLDGYINRKGEYIYKMSEACFGNFSDGMGLYIKDGLFGFIGTKGNVVIAPTFEYAIGFKEGVCPVMRDNNWFYIDKTGKKVSDDYMWAFPFSGGIASVCIDGKFSLINSKMEVKKLNFSYIGVAKEGLMVFVL